MVTPLDRFRGPEPTRRMGGLQVYSPGRNVLPPPPRPFARLPRGRQQTGGPGGALRYAADRDRQKRQEQGGSPFDALAPLGELAKGGLKVVDFARRGITLGVEEGIEALTGEELAQGDERSAWEKLTSDEHYGVANLLDEDAGPSWLRSTVGFAGDVLLDPLTYLTAGVGGVAGKSGRAMYAAKANLAGEKAIARAVASGADDVAIAALKQSTDDAVRKIGRYGPGVIKDPEMLAEIGLQKQGLRFGRPLSPGKGMRIGGDTKLGDALGEVARKSNELFAGGRAKFYDTPLGGKMQSWRTPELLMRAQKVIRSGQPDGTMDTPVALALTNYHDGARLGEKNFVGEMSPMFKKLTKKMRGSDPQRAVELAEQAGTTTEWNEFFETVAKKAKKNGVKFDTRKNFVPNILTKEGREALKKDKDVAHAVGVLIEDLDDPSGVTMPRKWVKGEISVNGVTVDIGEGTIAEKNRALAPILGVDKVFDDNMTSITTNYMRRLSSDVGKMNGLFRLTETFPNLAKTDEDAVGLASILTSAVDEVETEAANKAAVSELRSRLSKINTATGETRQEVKEAIEEGRSILNDSAGQSLKNIKSMRSATFKRLQDLERHEGDLVTRWNKSIEVFEDELDSMDDRARDLRSKVRQLEREEEQVRQILDDAYANVDRKQLAQQRATLISQKKRELATATKQLDADKAQLADAVQSIRNNRTKRRILANRRDKAPTPRPLPSDEGGFLQPRTTKGESMVQYASSPMREQRPDPTTTGMYGITAQEKEWVKLDAIDRQIEEFQKENRVLQWQNRDNPEAVADRIQANEMAIADLEQRLRNWKDSEGNPLPLLTEEGDTHWIHRNMVEGEAERARAENLNRSDIVEGPLVQRGERERFQAAEKIEAEAAEKVAQLREQQRLADIEQAGDVLEQEWLVREGKLTPQQEEMLERSQLLTPTERARLTKARKAEQQVDEQIEEFLDSPEGQKWLDEWSLIDSKVEILRDPQMRRKALEMARDPDSNFDLPRNLRDDQGRIIRPAREDLPVRGGEPGRKRGPGAGKLTLEQREAKAAYEALRANPPRQAPKSPNVGAIKDLRANIRQTESQIKNVQETIEHLEEAPLKGAAPRLDPTRQTDLQGGTISSTSTSMGNEIVRKRDVLGRKTRYPAVKMKPEVPAQQNRAAAIAQQQEKLAGLEEQLADYQRRLADLEAPGQKPLNPGAQKAVMTAYKRQLAEAKARFDEANRVMNRVLKENSPATTKFAKLMDRRANARATIDELGNVGRNNLRIKGSDQSHLDLSSRIRQIETDAKIHSARARRMDPDYHYSRRYRDIMNEDEEPIFVAGRVRLPRTRQEILDDIEKISGETSKPRLSKRAGKELRNRQAAFRYDTGWKTNPVAVAEAVLDDSYWDVPVYRNMLLHSGAMTIDDMMNHQAQKISVENAIEMLQGGELTGVRTDLNVSRLIHETERLRRTNEWMVKYAKVLDEGAEPSDNLARDIYARVVTKDIERLNRQIKAIKKNPTQLRDVEFESMYEMMEQAVMDLSAAKSWKVHADAIKNTPVLPPQLEIAKLESMTPRYEQYLRDHTNALRRAKTRRARGVKNNNNSEIKNAQRQIDYFTKQIESDRGWLRSSKARIAELHAGAESTDIKGLQRLIDGLNERNKAVYEQTKKMREAAPDDPDLVLTDDLIENFAKREAINDELMEALTPFFDDDTMLAIKAKLGNDVQSGEELQALIQDKIANGPDDMVREITYVTPEGVHKTVNTTSEMREIVAEAAGIEAASEMRRAKQMFSEIFDAMGLRKMEGYSKEMSIGFNESRQVFDESRLRKVLKDKLAEHRGMSSFDFVMRDLNARRARLKSIKRGLGMDDTGTRERNIVSAEIVDPGVKGTTERGRRAATAREFTTDTVSRDELPPLKAKGTKGGPKELNEAAKRRQKVLERTRQKRRDLAAGKLLPTQEGKSLMEVPLGPTVDWREAVWGESLVPRETIGTTKARGEQAARGLMLGSDVGMARPAGGRLLRGTPAAELRQLQEELVPYDETLQRFKDMGGRAKEQLGQAKATKKELEPRVAEGQKTVDELQRIIDENIGTSMTPELDAQSRRMLDRFEAPDSELNQATEELGQLDIERRAYEKAADQEFSKLSEDFAETYSNLRQVNEEIFGPKVNEGIPMGPIGSSGEPLPPMSSSTELAIPEVDPNRLALPKAGETAGPAQGGLDARIAQAEEIVRKTGKQSTKDQLRTGGAAAVQRDFETVMEADLGLDFVSEGYVKSMLADAVKQDSKRKALERSAAGVRTAIAKAEKNQLRKVSKDVILPTWKQMADGMMRGLDSETKIYMSQDLARHWTRLDEGLKDGKFWNAVEAYTNFFKTYATMRPDFHVRNAISAMFMNSSDGVPVSYNFSALREWKKFNSFKGKEGYVDFLRQNAEKPSGVRGLTNGQLADAFEVTLGSGAGGQFAERGVGGGLDITRSKIYNNMLTRASRTAGEYVEGPVRLAVALDSFANKGMDKYDAFARITRLHFDYADVSKMDQYAKRFIPFWTFMSRNLPLQITQMLGKPRWYAGYRSFERNFGTEGDPLAPEWWRDSGGFALRGRVPIVSDVLGTDDEIWLSPDLAHNRIGQDISAIKDLVTWEDPGKMLTSLNPLFTTPVELATNTDLFTGRNYQPDDLEKLGGVEKVLTPLLTMLGKAENGVVEEQLMESLRDALPLWGNLNNLFPNQVSGQPLTDVRASQQRARRLRFATGMPFQQLTEEQKQSTARGNYFDEQDERARRQAMERLLAESSGR